MFRLIATILISALGALSFTAAVALVVLGVTMSDGHTILNGSICFWNSCTFMICAFAVAPRKSF